MGKTLYEEALIDAKELKEAATRNAQNAIMEAVTPKIKQLIEQQLLEDDEELPAEKKSDEDEDDDILLDLAKDKGQSDLGISLPDKEGKVTLDMDKFITHEEEDEDEKEATSMPTDQSFDEPSDEVGPEAETGKDELQLDHNAVNALTKLSQLKEKMNENKLKKMVDSLHKNANSCKKSDVNSLLGKTEQLYEVLQESLSDSAVRQQLEDRLEKCYEALKQTKENNPPQKENTMLNEQDLMVAVSLPDEVEVDPTEVDVSVVEVEAEVDVEEVEGDAEEEVEVDDDTVELDLAAWLHEGDDEEEEVDEVNEGDDVEEVEEMYELNKLSDDTIIEISDVELKHELARMRMVREDTGSAARRRPQRKASAASSRSRKASAKPNHTQLAEKRARVATRNKKLQERKSALNELRTKLTESELFNAKLLFTNKLLQNDEVTSKQKLMVAERLDEAKSLREVKLIYDSLVELLKARKSTNESARRTKRVLGSSSKPTRSSSASNLNESAEAQRWAKLAGLNDK
jgi:hypothetical protein